MVAARIWLFPLPAPPRCSSSLASRKAAAQGPTDSAILCLLFLQDKQKTAAKAKTEQGGESLGNERVG